MCMLNKRFDMLMDKDMWNKVSKSAKSQNISFGEYVRRAVTKYMDSQKELQDKEKPKTPFNRFFKAGRR